MAYDFPSSPSVGQVYQGYTWDGQAWVVTGGGANAVRYDIAQGLSANQQAQGRSNIGALKKNYIINGAMQISQEVGASVVTATSGLLYPVDQFNLLSTSAGVLTGQQVVSPTPAGSQNRLRAVATTADTSVGAGDVVYIGTLIEGVRAQDLKLGSASAKALVIQFGVAAPAGTYCVSVRNAAANRSYVSEFTISAAEANFPVVRSVTLNADITGTWAVDNTVALNVAWCLMSGTTYQTPANAWAAGNFVATSNQFNFMGTNGNTFELFDVGLYEGSVAPPFMVPDYISELALCQRYFEAIAFPTALNQLFPSSTLTSTFNYSYWPFHVKKRALPTFALCAAGAAAWVNSIPTGISPTPDGVLFNHGTSYFYLGGTAGANAAFAYARL